MRKLYENNSLVLAGLIIIQLVVCLPFITSFPIALDEPFSIFWAQQDLSEMSTLFKTENNPPLHFVLLHFWIKLFGISAFAVRSLSLVFSLISVAILFKLALKFLSKEISIFVVLLFITSSFNHFHALEARTYSLVVLLFMLILYDLFISFFSSSVIIYLSLYLTALKCLLSGLYIII